MKICTLSFVVLLLFVSQVYSEDAAACNSTRLYNGVIVQVWDELYDWTFKDVFAVMEPSRNTLTYRQQAISWYTSVWKVSGLSASNNGPQRCSISGVTDACVFQPYRLNDLVRYQVYAIDLQWDADFKGRMPITNAWVKDDGYVLFIQKSVSVNVTRSDSSVKLTNIAKGDWIMYGVWRYYYQKNGNVFNFLNLRYECEIPISPSYIEFSSFDCRVVNLAVGANPATGRAMATIKISVESQALIPNDTLLRVTNRNIVTFPGLFEQKSGNATMTCDNIKGVDSP